MLSSKVLILFLFGLISETYVSAIQWEFAITTKSKIIFYNATWHEVETEAHRSTDISALEYDEFEDLIFFSDLGNTTGSIFALKLGKDSESHSVHSVVKSKHFEDVLKDHIEREVIDGIAYDALSKTLYWTDSSNKLIKRIKIDGTLKNNTNKVEVFMKFKKEVPRGIVIDTCGRNLYWSNSEYNSPTIEMISLTDVEPKSKVISKTVVGPKGMAISHSRKQIYWVDDMYNSNIIITAANFDGSEETVLYSQITHQPLNLVVDDDVIYWTDSISNTVWKVDLIERGPNGKKIEVPMVKLPTAPKGIIMRKNSLKNFSETIECKDVYQQILENLSNNLLLHDNNDEKVNLCSNYCLNKGQCTITSNNMPTCLCAKGYEGYRCENYMCYNYCLNNGTCILNNDKPTCECNSITSGVHCESKNKNEICLQSKNEISRDFIIEFFNDIEIKEVIENCNGSARRLEMNQAALINEEDLERSCAAMTKTIFVITSGVVVSLIIILLILLTLRRLYKPLRPRVKKTYVVRNLTALTSRPANEGTTTEKQCEITIENCCNMNICDTPCFDPKMLQGNGAIVSDGQLIKSYKEDKRNLLSDMDCNAELY